METTRVKIQQGDVLLKQVDPEEFEALRTEMEKEQAKHSWHNDWKITSRIIPESLKEAKCIVALGEATGHHHRFSNAPEGAIVTAYSTNSWRSKDNPAQCDFVAIENTTEDVTLSHEEHNPIQVPAGYYKVEIVREFDHFSQLERSVVD
tara:strand:- start:45 stop:491 length:447 start_codon:yes stop_codon:yes gene_type:complete